MFAQIDTKTVYTFMDSLIDLKTYIQKAKDLGYQTIGIMDRDNLYAAFHFIQEAKKEGLQPVLGLECAFSIKEWQTVTVQLIALNTLGYQNLMKLSSKQLSSGLELEDLPSYLPGIAVIIPYVEGIEEVACSFAVSSKRVP